MALVAVPVALLALACRAPAGAQGVWGYVGATWDRASDSAHVRASWDEDAIAAEYYDITFSANCGDQKGTLDLWTDGGYDCIECTNGFDDTIAGPPTGDTYSSWAEADGPINFQLSGGSEATFNLIAAWIEWSNGSSPGNINGKVCIESYAENGEPHVHADWRSDIGLSCPAPDSRGHYWNTDYMTEDAKYDANVWPSH